MKILKKWWFWVILVVVFIVIANGGNKNTPQKVGEKSVAANTTAKADTNAPKIFKIGDVIQLNNFKITVNGIRTLTQDKSGFMKADKGNEFLLINCTIENISKEEQTISSMLMFKVVDKDGMSYNQELFTDANGQLDGTIGATRKIKGEYVVQVPKGKTGLELEFDSSLFTGGQIIVKLR